MTDIRGQIAWVTGAGTGIGEAAAIALAAKGAEVVLSGRREAPLQAVRKTIEKAGGSATVAAGDLGDPQAVARIAGDIATRHGRLDLLLNNAGVNLPDRSWARLTPTAIQTLVSGNLTSALLVARAAIEMMRPRQGGLLIHTASWAGRFVGPVPGPVYIAAKHGVVAMSHSINLEECGNGIRSSVICPGEVATPIMALRDPSEPPEALARMVQPGDVAELVVFLAAQPPHVCINEVLISPTHNRGYLAQTAHRRAQQQTPRN